MTTVERYRPTHPFPSDALSNGRRSHPSSTTIANVPPAVPSPPRLSRNSPPQKPHIQAIPSPIFEMAHDDSSQWLFTDAEILSTPSILHGYPPEQERCYRAKGSNFILQAAILLKLPQLTIATASTFFHRFYMRASMDQNKGGYHHYTIAGTALFLASKTEETCRKTREIVVACAKVAQKNSNLVIDEQSKEYWRWRDNILLYEEMMLEYLTFDLVLDSPYNLLYGFLQRLHVEENKRLRNVAWSFLNDSCHTTICLAIPAKDIAIAAIYFGAKFNRDTIPDDENGNPWWEQLGGSPKRIVKGVAILAEFWTENPLRRSENPYEQSPMFLSNEDEVHRSRRRGDIGSSEDTPSPGQQSQPMQNGDSQQSHADSSRAINGNEDSQPRMNGRERPANGAESETKERPSPKANGEQKADSAVKTIEGGSGASDRVLKEVANDPATHEPDELKRSTQKRKSDEDAERSPPKRSKTDSDTTKSAGKPDDDSRENGTNKTAETTNGAKTKDNGEESEEGELDE